MISIKLAASVFTGPNGMFYGTPPNRAVFMLGSGRQDLFLAKVRTAYPNGHLSYRGGQTQLMIDLWGTEITDYTFEVYMKNQEGRMCYGEQILYLVVKGILEVYKDGVLLTEAAIDAFTA